MKQLISMLKFSMLKTNIKYIFIIFSLLVCLCGCAPKDNRTVVRFSSWGSESELLTIKPLIRDFEKQNPDIKVEFIHIPKNYFQKLHLLVASNLTPDVMFINNINGPIYAENNVFIDLSDYLKNDKTIAEKDFYKKAIQAFKYKKVIYAIPRDISNLVVFYNKDIFDKYNIKYPDENWTFNDFLTTAKKLTKDTNNDGKIDRFGTGFETLPLYWQPFIWSNGGDIITPNLQDTKLSSQDTIDGIQFYSNLRNKYHVAPKDNEIGSATMSQLFMQQKIAMQINGRWSVPRFRKDIKFHWDIAKFPRGKAGSIVDTDASGWAISKKSKHPEASWRLIKFLASKKSIEEFTKDGLIVPARIDIANSQSFLDNSKPPKHSEIFIKIIPESRPTSTNQNYQEIMDIINAALEPVWNGSKTANQAITPNLVKKVQKLL